MTGRALRVARVIARLNVGGPAQHVVWLTAGLRRAGHETILITGTVPPGETDMSALAASQGVVPVVIREMSRELSPRDAITVWKLFRTFTRFKPDVVHTHTAKAGATGRVAAFLYRWFTPAAILGRPRRVGVIHTYHGHIFHGYYGSLKTRLFLIIEKALARITSRIVVLSSQQLDEIHGRFGIGRAEQFRIVPLGVDLDACRGDRPQGDALRDDLGIARDATVVAIVGRLAPVKEHRLFLALAARLADVRPDLQFVVFGDGELREELEARASAPLLVGRVTFAGTRTAAQIYGATDIAVLTSRNEGTPLTIIEAMANGVPVVSTAVGGVVDLLGAVTASVDGFEVRERGLTAPSGDAEGLAAAVIRVLDDAALTTTLVSRAEAYAKSAHGLDRLVSDVERISREAAGID